MPINRGRERQLHLAGKRMLGLLLSSRKFLALFEHKLADVVAFRLGRGGGRRIVCGEHELTNRNVRRNVQRNFFNGCSAMVILVPEERARTAIRRLLRREFPRHIWTRVGILTHDTCCRQMAKMPPISLPQPFQTWVRTGALPRNTNK